MMKKLMVLVVVMALTVGLTPVSVAASDSGVDATLGNYSYSADGWLDYDATVTNNFSFPIYHLRFYRVTVSLTATDQKIAEAFFYKLPDAKMNTARLLPGQSIATGFDFPPDTQFTHLNGGLYHIHTMTLYDYLGSPNVSLDGQIIQSDVPAVIGRDDGGESYVLDGRTYLPVRAIAEALGGTVTWDGSTQTAQIAQGGHTIRMTMGSQTYTVDGVKKQMDASPWNLDGRTVVPVRYLAESLGLDVQWDQANYTVRLTH